MSTVTTVGIGVAWAIMAIAAFVALSASALANGRHELEFDPRSAPPAAQPTSGDSRETQTGARAHAQWPAIETVPMSAVLRSSPSVAYMHASGGHAGSGPIHLS